MKTQASKTLKLALALAVVLVPGMMATPSTRAQTYRVLHSFAGRPVKHARYYWLLLAESHLRGGSSGRCFGEFRLCQCEQG